MFPDIGQILANNTNAVTGVCPPTPAPPTAIDPVARDCYSEFLPTAAYVGFASDRTLNFRLTARDGNAGAGGIGSADTKLTLAPNAGPFLVTSQATATTLRGGSTQTVTGTWRAPTWRPVSTSTVKISLSTDGGVNYPHVLAGSTANDGTADVTLPNVAAAKARIKVEAVGNVFFDISDAHLVVLAAPALDVDDPTVQYSDAVAPATVVTATDEDSAGSALTATATGLPAGLSLVEKATGPHERTWTLAGTVSAPPGTYAGTVTVTDGDGEAITAPLTVTVTREDAVLAYAGDTLSSGSVLLRATVEDSADGAPGDIRKATVLFREGSRTLCGPLRVSTGAVSCRVNLASGTHAITAEAGDHYTGTAAATVRVNTKPKGRVDAIGTLPNAVFAIDNRFAEIAYLSGSKAFRISADDIDSIGFSSDGRRAELRAKADLWDHSRLFWPVRVARDATLHVSLSESGRGTVAFSLWDGDELLYEQPERSLSGGFVTIR